MKAAYWRCSCGESAGGRWYRSVEEAIKAADRHVRRHTDESRHRDHALGPQHRPLTGTLTDYSNGLPDLDGMTVTQRPDEFMPATFDFRDPTAVTTTIKL